jgi:hypothetical protein
VSTSRTHALLYASAAVLLAGPSSAFPAPAGPLPRSSIAAVLAHRGELGLDDAQVKQLEDRDAALQKQIAEIRSRAEATPPGDRASKGRNGGRPSGSDGAPPPLSPVDAARPGGFGGGGMHRGSGGGMGGHRGGAGSQHPARDPAERAAALQTRIDDADTAAWLAAEALLRESQREKARAVAEKYREALADEREAARAGR